jgi:primosomal protein N' (replication factor Y)
MEPMGWGTEKVEQVLKERFPEARVARLDRDTSPGKNLRAILKRVAQKEVDFLVGTQMVTKGHDFPHVTLVGVLCADQSLHFPDFRASERTFQLITQVAGRAGRGERPGQVIVQTYAPDHHSIVCAQHHDYLSFYEGEIALRESLNYPPCGYLVALRVDGRDPGSVKSMAEHMVQGIRRSIIDDRCIQVLGPAEAPIQRLKGRTRWFVLIKGNKRSAVHAATHAGLRAGRELKNRMDVRFGADVDPMLML